jgi:ubiquitin-activating enzyme E1
MALSSGDFEITEVQGCDGINDQVYVGTHGPKDPAKSMRIPLDVRSLPPYHSGGVITEKKLPKPYPMLPLSHKIREPGNTFAEPPTLVLTDLLNFGSELQNHVAFVATHNFLKQHSRMPTPNSTEDADAVVALAKACLGSQVQLEDFEIDESLVRRYALHAAAELQPMSAFFGGVLAQEVVKCTGKFTPIPGFLHYACPEVLSSDPVVASDCTPRGHRNDELASVFGWSFVEKLSNLKYFMVGCGALGCEFLKNFALNSICCGPQGSLTVTDADRIELSNLTRQFLFREHNVGQPKSKAAAVMAKVMNPGFNVTALEMFVGVKTENVFNDDFWMPLDGVCNALDNMEARFYVDNQCVKYQKSLLESGTMGPNGNVDTIVPFKTRTYQEGGKAADTDGVPMCTLRNFPQVTDHCIEWARDQFELLFVKLNKKLELAASDFAAFEAEQAKLKPAEAAADARFVLSLAQAAQSRSVQAAAQVAFDFFHYLFRDKILDLQALYPRDARKIDSKTKEDKGPFWGLEKRYPTAAVFNPADESHLAFMRSTTAMVAVALGAVSPKTEGDDSWLAEWHADAFVADMASKLQPPKFEQSPMHIDGETEEMTARVIAEGQRLSDRLMADLRVTVGSLNAVQLVSQDFEKDDDANFHIAFVTAAANLRCDNYSIKRTDFHACKVIAGKIIAAIATTTAAVCGLVMLELFKVQQQKPTDAYMNRQIGLATNAYTSFTQEPPVKYETRTEKKVPGADEQATFPPEAFHANGKLKDEYITEETIRMYPNGHTLWDKLEVDGSMTLDEFAEWLEEEHKLELDQWNFVYGYRKVVDAEGHKSTVPSTARVFPASKPLNYALIPSLDLSPAEATKALMRAGARPQQQYESAWAACKAAGKIEAPPVDPLAITPDTTLAQVLSIMQQKGELAEQHQVDGFAYKTVSCIDQRKFWVIPSSECPGCNDEEGEPIDTLASLKIKL